MKFLRELFDFLASLKLAVIVLVTLAVSLASATIVESLYDTDTAKHYFYSAPWFTVLLLVLGLNVLCAALSRWPFKPRHYGFVVTHAGIILMLIGSWMTMHYGVEGLLSLDKGEASSQFMLYTTVVSLYSPKLNQTAEWPVAYRFNPPSQAHPSHLDMPGGPKVAVYEYLPTALRKPVYVKGDGDQNPAVHFGLDNNFVHVDEWVGGTTEESQRVDFGPASVLLKVAKTPAELQALLAPQHAPRNLGQLQLKFPDTTAMVDVGRNLEQTVPIENTQYQIHIIRYLPDAVPDESKQQLINQSDKPINPAVEFELITPQGGREVHSVFARFFNHPEVPTLHGATDQHTRVQASFKFDPAAANDDQLGNQVLLIAGPGDKLYANVHAKSGLDKAGELTVGQAWDTGFRMGLKLTVKDFYPHAMTDSQVVAFVPRRGMKENDEPPPAIHVMIANNGDTHDLWIRRGEAYGVMVGGENLEIAFRPRMQPMGFNMKLDSFKIGHDPGTDNDASYQSTVTYSDPKNGVQPKEAVIQMNEPLHYNHWTVFQSSFQRVDGVPRISTFQIAYDPGVPVKYAGSLVMCLGIATMFWLRGWYQGLGKKKKPPTQQASGSNGKSSTEGPGLAEKREEALVTKGS
ncbi:MAG: cytochrome c biogenesis protein ResB [Candidatus Xenobia bacterium]